jgi:hypothetical protein
MLGYALSKLERLCKPEDRRFVPIYNKSAYGANPTTQLAARITVVAPFQLRVACDEFIGAGADV